MRTRPFLYLVVLARQINLSRRLLQMKVTEVLPNGKLQARYIVSYPYLHFCRLGNELMTLMVCNVLLRDRSLSSSTHLDVFFTGNCSFPVFTIAMMVTEVFLIVRVSENGCEPF